MSDENVFYSDKAKEARRLNYQVKVKSYAIRRVPENDYECATDYKGTIEIEGVRRKFSWHQAHANGYDRNYRSLHVYGIRLRDRQDERAIYRAISEAIARTRRTELVCEIDEFADEFAAEAVNNATV